jgi:hypothetical protein
MTKPTIHVEQWGDRKATVVTAPEKPKPGKKLYDPVAGVIIVAALLVGGYLALQANNLEPRDVYDHVKDTSDMYRDKGQEPAWAQEAFEAK